jgi:hypothetical protein
MPRKLTLIAPDLLDEALGVLAADVDLERIAYREVRRERMVDHGVHEHAECIAPRMRII